jgi:hypothetical protein
MKTKVKPGYGDQGGSAKANGEEINEEGCKEMRRLCWRAKVRRGDEKREQGTSSKQFDKSG